MQEVNMDYSNIILEMLDRIKTLEQEVTSLKQIVISNKQTNIKRDDTAVVLQESPLQPIYMPLSGKRDTTRYMFEGNVYLKNKLVLAVVKSYIAQNTDISRFQLKYAFDKSLQGSIGVVENVEIAKQRSDYQVRFFTKEEDVLHLTDGDMYVCNQWGILNIPNFIKRANQLGFEIESIK